MIPDLDILPNPAAPNDPDTALLATCRIALNPQGWYAIPYTYTVIERITPTHVI